MSAFPTPDPMVSSDSPAPSPQPQQPAPAAQPSMWKNVLLGALTGLKEHGAIGAVEGAINPAEMATHRKQNEDLRQAKVEQAQGAAAEFGHKFKFQDAMAANAVAEAAKNNALAAALPQQARDAHDKNSLELLDTMNQLGITPTIVADDTHEGAAGALDALTESRGAVPHLFTIEVRGQHLGYDLSQLSGTPQGLQVINNARAVQGMDPITPAQWRQTPKAAQTQTAENALKFWRGPDAPGSASQAESNLLQYQGWLNAYKKSPSADPETVKKMQSLVDNVSATSKAMTQHETNMAANKESLAEKLAGAKEAIISKRTPVYAEDASGQTILSNRAAAQAAGQPYEEVKPGAMSADRASISQLNDVQLNASRYTKAANDAIKNPPSAQDIAGLHIILNKAGVADFDVAISEGGHIKLPAIAAFSEGLSRQISSQAYKDLSPQAKALFDGYLRTMSSVPAYQKALTGIGRTNKEMLDLELANIGNPTLAPADILRKQQAFQENIDQATKRLPKLPGLKTPTETRQQVESGSTPANKHSDLGFIPSAR